MENVTHKIQRFIKQKNKSRMMIQEKPRLLLQRVHRNYLIREAEHFRDHKKGLPEWLKNSDDSYTRHEEFDKKDFSDLPILLNIDKKNIFCLDFGGANSKDMIEHIPFYGSPEAATQGKLMINKAVSGGHGNGGKYYALSQFAECRIISYYNSKLTILRLDKEGDYVDIEGLTTSPDEVINLLGINKWDYFQKEGKGLLYQIKNYRLNLFCWKGIDPKDKSQISNKRILARVLNSVANHPQSRSALRFRKVHVLFEGRILWPDMKPEEVKIDETFGVREFSLPNKLEENIFNKHFNSVLKVALSKEPLTGEKSSLNILEIDAFGRNIAYYEIPILMVDKGLSKNLYAHIDCPELKEYNCVSNDRVRLIENLEITKLFLEWCKSKIREVLEELTNKEKKKEERKHLDDLGTFLREITNEISELLEEENILTPQFKKGGDKKEKVEAPTEKPGYGGEGKIKHSGGGKRTGGTEIQEAQSTDKKGKSRLQILLSNHDEDPLNRGKTYDMIERQAVLFQRVEDVDYGIWWINSQKNYIKKIKIKDPGAMPFYFFLVKEIVLSSRQRRRFKEQDRYDPDGLEEMNFQLIDEVFNKIVERLGIELAIDINMSEKIRETIRNKEKFTVSELSEDLAMNPVYIHAFINNPSNGVLENFNVIKEDSKGKGGRINVYVKK